MQFSDTSNNTGIVEDIDFLVGTNSTSYPLKDKARNVNNWYHKTIGWILESSPEWEWDDSNYTNLPIALADLVADQEDYTLPQAAASSSDASTFLKLIGVSILDSGGSIYHKLRHLDESDLPHHDIESTLNQTSGFPIWYKTIGNTLKILPAPASADVTTTNGLKVYYQRTMDEFTSTDTTQEPGFPRTFHRILSFGGAYDYAIAQGFQEKAGALRQEIEQLKQQLQEFYGQQNRDVRIRFQPRELRKIKTRI